MKVLKTKEPKCIIIKHRLWDKCLNKMYEQRKPKKVKLGYYVFLKCWLLCWIYVVLNVHMKCSMKTFPLLSIGLKNLCLQFPELTLYTNHENWSKIVVNKSEKPFHFSGSFVWFMYSKGFICFGFTRTTEELEKNIYYMVFMCLLSLSRCCCYCTVSFIT